MEREDPRKQQHEPNAPAEGQQKSEQLLADVYEQLRAIARHRLSRESPGHTLQATALVNEAYLRLCQNSSIFSADRGRFVMAAAEAMRRVLIDHARTRKRIKRGGGMKRAAEDISDVAAEISDVADLASDQDPEQIMALDAAIRRFEQEDPQAAQVVKLRFYAGLSVEETAEALGISTRTVKRDWQYARAWLFRALNEDRE
jgi:RNA polymerase sigma factor (TIGR02999 family)